MFKRKLFVLGVFALAVVTIVGSGFSAWTFSKERRFDVNTGVNITEAVAFGTLYTEDAWRLTLDQSGITLDKAKAAVNVTDSKLVTNDNFLTSNTLSADWYITKAELKEACPEAFTADGTLNIANANLKFNLNLYLSDPASGNGLYDYVKVNSAFTEKANVADSETGSAHQHPNTKAYQITLSATNFTVTQPSVDKTINITSANNVFYKAGDYYKITISYTLPNDLFTYNTTNKPTTFEQYRTMVANLSGVPATGTNAGTAVTEVASVQAGINYYMPANTNHIVFEFQVINTNT